jgi:hypothetical protein
MPRDERILWNYMVQKQMEFERDQANGKSDGLNGPGKYKESK